MPLKCEAVIQNIKDKVAAADPNPANRTILAVFQFNITVGGKQVQQWTMDLKDLKVYEGPSKVAADVTVTIDDEAIVKIASSELNHEAAIKEGKMKVEGDQEVMKKFVLLVMKLKEKK